MQRVCALQWGFYGPTAGLGTAVHGALLGSPLSVAADVHHGQHQQPVLNAVLHCPAVFSTAFKSFPCSAFVLEK